MSIFEESSVGNRHIIPFLDRQLIQTSSDGNDFSGYVYGIFSVFSISEVPGKLRAINQSLPSDFSPNFSPKLVSSRLVKKKKKEGRKKKELFQNPFVRSFQVTTAKSRQHF